MVLTALPLPALPVFPDPPEPVLPLPLELVPGSSLLVLPLLAPVVPLTVAFKVWSWLSLTPPVST